MSLNIFQYIEQTFVSLSYSKMRERRNACALVRSQVLPYIASPAERASAIRTGVCLLDLGDARRFINIKAVN